MDAIYFTFQSMTLAQSAAAVLKSNRISANLMRAPKAISVAGCGFAIQVNSSEAYRANFVLRGAGLIPAKTFRAIDIGRFMEVYL